MSLESDTDKRPDDLSLITADSHHLVMMSSAEWMKQTRQTIFKIVFVDAV